MQAAQRSASARAARRWRWRRRTRCAQRLEAAHGPGRLAFEMRVIRTSGDRIQDRPLAEVGGKGLFTKEIEEALLAGEIDIAVHSMKDMPTVLPAGLAIACLLPREDVRDAFISAKAASARRAAGGRRGRHVVAAAPGAGAARCGPTSTVVPMRGNVETRLRKLADGVADATLLACAGLKRLGLAEPHHVADLDRRDAAGGGAGRHRRRDARRRRGDGRAAGPHQPRADGAGRDGRARLPRQARRLLPHADRRPRRACRRPSRLPRHDPHARRPPVPRDPARGPAGGSHRAWPRMRPPSCSAKAGPDFLRAPA